MLQSPHLVSASNAKGKSHLFITPPVHVMLITISCRLTTPVVEFSAILRCQCLGQVRLPIFKKKIWLNKSAVNGHLISFLLFNDLMADVDSTKSVFVILSVAGR